MTRIICGVSLIQEKESFKEFASGHDPSAPVHAKPNERLNDQRLVWKVQYLNSSIASVRYRCLYPVKYLNEAGLRSDVYSDADLMDLSGSVRALIFVKSFSAQDLIYARLARKRGIPVILDICDNLFVKGKISEVFDPVMDGQVEGFKAMAGIANGIVTTGDSLAEAVREVIPNGLKIYVIPDGIESSQDVQFAKSFAIRQLMQNVFGHGLFWLIGAGLPRLTSLSCRTGAEYLTSISERLCQWVSQAYAKACKAFGRTFFKSSPVVGYFVELQEVLNHVRQVDTPNAGEYHHDLPQLIWFGNSGKKGLFGISDLSLIKLPLEATFNVYPFQLCIVSDSYDQYKEVTAGLSLPTRFVRWTPEGLFQELNRSKIALFPNQLNPFSICKSANRALLALNQGVNVIATRTPALTALETCIVLDDWESGLRDYLGKRETALVHLRTGRNLIEEKFNGKALGSRWLSVLSDLEETR